MANESESTTDTMQLPADAVERAHSLGLVESAGLRLSASEATGLNDGVTPYSASPSLRSTPCAATTPVLNDACSR
ncbi:hypothetical protein Slu03_13290 [Sediminihabitans luteus]|nr:hypothetical protein Slu03_13290 [Sediminihabitans luteus]